MQWSLIIIIIIIIIKDEKIFNLGAVNFELLPKSTSNASAALGLIGLESIFKDNKVVSNFNYI